MTEWLTEWSTWQLGHYYINRYDWRNWLNDNSWRIWHWRAHWDPSIMTIIITELTRLSWIKKGHSLKTHSWQIFFSRYRRKKWLTNFYVYASALVHLGWVARTSWVTEWLYVYTNLFILFYENHDLKLSINKNIPKGNVYPRQILVKA